MKIELKKFGTMLISRQAGKEALSAFESTLKNIPEDEELSIDFDGVITFSPSWGTNFLHLYLEDMAKDLNCLKRIILLLLLQ